MKRPIPDLSDAHVDRVARRLYRAFDDANKGREPLHDFDVMAACEYEGHPVMDNWRALAREAIRLGATVLAEGRSVKPFSWWRMSYWRFRWYVYPRHRYATRCQYCTAPTGETMHAWATEDVCSLCAALVEPDVETGVEHVVETGSVT